MSTNKERIERVEVEIGSLQDGMKRMELGLTDRLHRLEETMSKLVDSLSTSKGTPSHNNSDHTGPSQPSRGDSEGSRHQLASRLTKLECTRYFGDNPTEWYNRIMQFFEYQEATNEQKVSLASLTSKERPTNGGSGCDKLIKKRKRQQGCYVIIRGNSKGLGTGYEAGRKRPWKLLRPQYLNRTSPAPTNNTRAQPTRPIKWLTWDEMQRRRAMGLCFNCNDRFTAGHKCTQPQLLLLESETTNDKTTYEGILEVLCTEPDTREPTDPKITFYALTGWAAPRTMRVTAKVGPYEIMVLIDNGSTHNFISSQMANMLQLPIIPTTRFSVRVANRETLSCQGKFERVQVLLQEVPFTLTLYSLPITGLDMVLGVQWLEMLGSVVCNWKQLTMDFTWENKSCRLQGIGPQSIQTASLTEITKELRQGQSVDDMLDELHGAAYFTKLDLRAGYHQVRVNLADIHKRAFRTHNGHYEYLVMPFGLCNAPSTFQAIMNSIFRPYLRKFILVFFEDILIYCPSWRSHLTHVKQAMEVLKQHQFFLKAIKCTFGQQELEYLSHIITSHGVKVDETKIAAMVSWPQPKNISELRGFLGLTGYYRKFVQGYGVLARPLTNLLKKGQFEWNAEADKAFINLKKAMTSTPTLAMPNFNETFVIVTDASGDGISAILQQQGQPIAFMSRALGVTKKSWSTYAKEMLAIIEAIHVSIWNEIKTAAQDDDYMQQITHQALTQPAGPYFMLVVDRLSKSAHFMALTHPFTAKTVAEKFIDGVVKLHGMSKSIISDRDPIFISKFWKEFCHMSGTQLKMSSAYYPQTDSQIEVINRCLEQYLRSFVHQWPKQWNSYLPWAEYWYNTTYHESTCMTPFLALYGRHPPVVPMYHVGSSPVHEVDQALLSRDELLRQLKQNLEMATNRMKQFADTKRRDVEFKEGDIVFLRLPPYSADLPYVDDGGVLVLEPDRIIDVHWLKRGGKLVEQSLVRWKRLPHEDATWEDSEFLEKQFPHLTLEDKGPLYGGGIDTPRRSSRIPKPSNKYAGYV
ncbi:hypothetical protein KPL71_021710 [Citrus sinensis]|uniref:Uncharacterized protein n=1 Tax=Citrus sinensis TaxID=2711 RepID=A0ACB8JHL9_CITSI|nr:hypothetical protein KPL71_021710 [Citrus sinensis]